MEGEERQRDLLLLPLTSISGENIHKCYQDLRTLSAEKKGVEEWVHVVITALKLPQSQVATAPAGTSPFGGGGGGGFGRPGGR